MSITLRKIAKLANVSVSTASKALNYSKEVHEETARLVRSIAKENGYFLSKKISSLQNKVRKMPKVAIISPEVISINYALTVTKIAEYLRANGMQAQAYICNFDGKIESDIFKECLEDSGVVGVISFMAGDGSVDADFPFVRLAKSPYCNNCIHEDSKTALFDAVNALKQRGHEHIAFFGEKLTTSRMNAFKSALVSLDMTDDDICWVSSKRFEAAGFDLMGKLVASGKPLPSAILCAYDEIALGAMKRLNEFGLSSPKDISFIGMNDIPTAQYSVPSLSSISFDRDFMCKTAVEILSKEIFSADNEHHEYREVIVPHKVILRDSVR